MDIIMRKACNQEDYKLVSQLAASIWKEHYTPIIGEAQVKYMLSNYQSEAAITKQAYDGVTYRLVFNGSVAIGYYAYEKQGIEMFLSKIYLDQSQRGKGIARKILNDVIAQSIGQQGIYLTVNKNNEHSIKVYKKMGFQIIKSIKTDIGNGYYMNDFMMRLPLNEN